MSAWHYPSRVVAHRGGGTIAPENTLAGLREAHARGYRAVEFDVMLARADVPVLMHDDTLERTTNGHGDVAMCGAEDLARLDAGSWRDARFAGEPVPSFDTAASLCRALGLFANVEVKPWAPGGDAVAATTGRLVGEACARHWNDSAAQVLMSSFSATSLASAREVAPHLARAHLFDAVPDDWHARLTALDCVALHCNGKTLEAATARAIKDAGFGLMCWTVNEPEQAQRLFDLGVDAVCTDRLDLFVRFL